MAADLIVEIITMIALLTVFVGGIGFTSYYTSEWYKD